MIHGLVSFETIFPACYSGRWPHIHFEVYSSARRRNQAAARSPTSQIALPAATCHEVFATEGYDQSVDNLSQTSLANDNVFGDDGGASTSSPRSPGTPLDGYVANLTIGV